MDGKAEIPIDQFIKLMNDQRELLEIKKNKQDKENDIKVRKLNIAQDVFKIITNTISICACSNDQVSPTHVMRELANDNKLKEFELGQIRIEGHILAVLVLKQK